MAEQIGYGKILLVEYEPFNPGNQIDKLEHLAQKVATAPPRRLRFSRYDPDLSTDCWAETLLSATQGTDSCVLDLSGMSRFLIVILTARLRRLGLLKYVVYSEPALYRPSHEEFEFSQKRGMDDSLLFQTTGLHGIVAVRDLTTVAMQGCPQVLVASPTFEPLFLRALLNDIEPAKLILFEGVPPAAQNAWRRDAVRDLNRTAFRIAGDNILPISTDSAQEAADTLRRVYDAHKYTHRLVVAPAASKLASLGLALALTEGVEAEVIYPTPTGFSDPYTDGVGGTRILEIVTPGGISEGSSA